MSLKKAAVRGMSFASVSRIASQAIGMVTLALLATLLTPSEFGLVGLASIVTGFLSLFNDFGTGAAIVQREKLSPSLLASVFWFNIGVSLFLASGLLFTAPVVAEFFETPALAGITRVLAFTFLLNGFATVPAALLRRALKFKEIAVIEVASVTFGAIAGVSFAYMGYGAWSLVYQALSRGFCNAVLSNWFSTWRPSFRFSKDDFRSVVAFSGNLTGFNTLNYFVRNADNLLIGKFLGAEALGFYSLAYRIMLFPIQNLTRVLVTVMFPIFSRTQSDNERFRDAYISINQTIALIAFPCMAGLCVVAEPLTVLLFGEEWRVAGKVLMVLAPVGAIQSVGATVGVIYQAKGKTGQMFAWGIASACVFIPIFTAGLKFGVIGVALSYLVASAVLVLPSLILPFRLIELSVWRFFASLSRTLAVSILMSAIVLAIQSILASTQLSPTSSLGCQIGSGVMVYAGLTCTFNKPLLRRIHQTLFSKTVTPEPVS